jgi:hypothetical protein
LLAGNIVIAGKTEKKEEEEKTSDRPLEQIRRHP